MVSGSLKVLLLEVLRVEANRRRIMAGFIGELAELLRLSQNGHKSRAYIFFYFFILFYWCSSRRVLVNPIHGVDAGRSQYPAISGCWINQETL